MYIHKFSFSCCYIYSVPELEVKDFTMKQTSYISHGVIEKEKQRYGGCSLLWHPVKKQQLHIILSQELRGGITA